MCDNANITKDTGFREHSRSKVQCTNVFKNKNTISNSLTNIWTDIINTLENTGSTANNDVVKSSTHHTLDTEGVGK